MLDKDTFLITIKTQFGAEEVLQDELRELGYTETTALNRAVQLQGTLRDIYFLNLHLRCAMSILIQVAKFRIREENDIYKQAMKVDWTSFFDVKKTFVVKGAVQSNMFKHTKFPMLLVKDAIADTFRDKVGERPNVELKSPQIAIDVYIKNDEVTLSLNTSGAPLFQRGYRTEVGLAPLNEVTAAILLRMSGWDRKSDFMDPFCGSGTLLIEAALLAHGIPSNIERQHYAFKNLKNFDAKMWDEIYGAIDLRPKKLPFTISGSDIEAEMVLKTRRNLRIFSFGRFIEVKNASFEEMKRTSERGTLISNPPYGERMGEEVEELYENLGNWFKSEMKGWECWLISSNEEAMKHVGLKPDKKVKLFNGDLECSYRKYKIFEGSHKDFVTAEKSK
jgi:putative N6-adenine-specific DNA methylase